MLELMPGLGYDWLNAEPGDHLFSFVLGYLVFELMPRHDPWFALERDKPLVVEDADACPHQWCAREVTLPNMHGPPHIASPRIILDQKLAFYFDGHDNSKLKWRVPTITHLRRQFYLLRQLLR
jgi:hypothetical protein